ncbi:MAG: GatB/YqeY domain-containing protein [Chloroflexi bacterium]|nr:MAG: GatB/YqeY domain-containing protein [Chloroflexota bacterium]
MTRMSLFQKLETDLAEARRRSDAVALGSLGLLKSEVVNASKEAGFSGSIDDALVIGTARKEIKRRQESAAAYTSAGRTEAAERELAAAEVLKPYLPAQLGPAELEAELRKVIADIEPSGPAGFGQVMKEANLRLAGRASGSDIAATAKRLLAGG